MKRVGIALLSLLFFLVLQTYVHAIPSILAANPKFSMKIDSIFNQPALSQENSYLTSLQGIDRINASAHLPNENFASGIVPEHASLLLLGLGLIGLALYGRKKYSKKKEA